jgi:hypothetical protein
MRKISLALLFCLSALLGESSQALAQDNALQEGTAALRSEPVITALSQPGSPLSISSTTRWLKPEQQIFDIYIVVTNVGKRSIRAYATYNSYAGESQESRGCFLHNFTSIGKVLQPGQKDGRSIWRTSGPDFQPNIELAVDFVEFTDGGVWGTDTCQSMQRLEGMRAGAQATKAELKRILQDKGPEGVVVELKEIFKGIDVPQGRSSVWVEGFRAGITSLREKVAKAYEEGGIPDINAALQRPFDASESP